MKREEECISNNRTFKYSMPFLNIPTLSNPTLSDGCATPSPYSTQSVRAVASPSHQISPSHPISPSNPLSPSQENLLSPVEYSNIRNVSQQNITKAGDWQYDIDQHLVTGFDQDANYDPEAFFNEHLSPLIYYEVNEELLMIHNS